MIISLALAALMGAVVPAPSHEAACYDRAVVGYLVKAEHPVALQDLMSRHAAGKSDVYIGARWDVTIRVQRSLAGAPHDRTIHARVVLTDLYKPSTPLLLILRKGPLWADGEDVVMSSPDGWSNVPAATPDHPWRVISVAAWHDGVDPSDVTYPPRCG